MIQKTAGTLAAVSDKTTDITLAHKLTCEPHTKTFTVFYGYDEFGRVASVSSAVPVLAFGFSYLPGTVVVSGMTGTAGLGRSVTFEPSQKLITGVSNVWVESPVAVFAYGNDVLGRRVARNAETFVYNGLSEVIGATIGTNGYGYAYDGIGNRIWSAENALTNIYTINCLNQYAGLSYDADGNLLSDGEHTFSWDAENRNTTVLSNGVPLVANSYDPQHQRVIKATPVSAHTFLYDGWLPVLESGGIAEVREHVWGKDLSGTRKGAGGVGGLLATRIGDAWFFPLYDNNGNITDYVNESGATVAHREYGPYGNTVAASGPMADTFNFWFSTKHLNHVTGWYYYGERLYSPELRRWLNCDPIGEKGGKNRYGIGGNNPVNNIEILGLMERKILPVSISYERMATAGGRFFANESLICTCDPLKGGGKRGVKCMLLAMPRIILNSDEPLRKATQKLSSHPEISVETHERNHFNVFMAQYVPKYEMLVNKYEDISCCNCQERIVDLYKRFAELKRKLSEIENMLEYGWADPDGKLVDPGGRAPWIDYGRDGDFIVDVPEPSVRGK